MEKLKEFYGKLSQKRKIIFCVCIAVVFLSVLRVIVWKVKKGNMPTARTYMRELRSSNKEEQIMGIFGVGVTNNKKAIPVLEQIIKEESDLRVKRAAISSLGKLDKNKVIDILNGDNNKAKLLAMEALITMDKENISLIFSKFPDQDEETKTGMLTLLEKMKNPEYQDHFIHIAENRSEPVGVRAKALSILKDTGSRDVENRLWNIYYSDSNEKMKKLAKETIKAIKERTGKKDKSNRR